MKTNPGKAVEYIIQDEFGKVWETGKAPRMAAEARALVYGRRHMRTMKVIYPGGAPKEVKKAAEKVAEKPPLGWGDVEDDRPRIGPIDAMPDKRRRGEGRVVRGGGYDIDSWPAPYGHKPLEAPDYIVKECEEAQQKADEAKAERRAVGSKKVRRHS
jgi:hypothetical protein